MAREFRALSASGARLRPVGEARRDPARLLVARLRAAPQARALRAHVLPDRRAPERRHPLLRRPTWSCRAVARAPPESTRGCSTRTARCSGACASHYARLRRRELDRQGRHRGDPRAGRLRAGLFGASTPPTCRSSCSRRSRRSAGARRACGATSGRCRWWCAAAPTRASRPTATSRRRAGARARIRAIW